MKGNINVLDINCRIGYRHNAIKLVKRQINQLEYAQKS